MQSVIWSKPEIAQRRTHSRPTTSPYCTWSPKICIPDHQKGYSKKGAHCFIPTHGLVTKRRGVRGSGDVVCVWLSEWVDVRRHAHVLR
jgi:hypothetical protein